MLIQHAIWKVGAKTEALTVSKLATEKELEDTRRVPETYNTSVLRGTDQLLIEIGSEMATARSAKRVGIMRSEVDYHFDEIGSSPTLIKITLVYGIVGSLAFVPL